jgi:hypothetical protein
MDWTRWRGTRKRRPRAHVLADLGVNFLERQILRRGHQLIRVPQPEYGIDAFMHHFSPDSREIENGRVEFQVKASDHLRIIARGDFVSCKVEMSHAHYWYWQVPHPVILVVYDAPKHRAFWLDIQSYLEIHPPVGTESLTVRIPAQNKINVRAIDRFRQMSLARIQRLTHGG